MTSLRSRLILAFAAVAVVPLFVAVVWLGGRIERAVREEADGRLDAALALADVRLRDEGSRVATRVTALAADPQLRRLYLLGGSTAPELLELLARERSLLDLDYLAVIDRDGVLVADAASAPGAAGLAVAARDVEDAPAPGGARFARLPGRRLAIDASAPIVFGGEPVGVLRGGARLDSTRLARFEPPGDVALVLRAADGAVLASTAAGAAPSPADTAGRTRSGALARTASVALSGGPAARLTALSGTAAADAAVASLRRTALLLSLAGIAIAVVLGIFWSRRISRPVERLARFSERMARGEWEEPLAVESVGEVRTLVTALERMRRDLRDYRDRLTTGERQAAYGRMAREVAHEIRNPLTPIAVSVADLRRTFELGRPEFPQVLDQATRVIDEEIHRLKRLLEEFSELGRFPPPRFSRWSLEPLLAELATLYAHEVRAGRLAFVPADVTLDADRDQVRQALLNLVQNALEAGPARGPVEVRAAAVDGAAEIAVRDQGPGLGAEERARLFVPGYTTKPRGSGIGLALVERIASDHGGTVSVASEPGCGATFRLRLPLVRGA